MPNKNYPTKENWHPDKPIKFAPTQGLLPFPEQEYIESFPESINKLPSFGLGPYVETLKKWASNIDNLTHLSSLHYGYSRIIENVNNQGDIGKHVLRNIWPNAVLPFIFGCGRSHWETVHRLEYDRRFTESMDRYHKEQAHVPESSRKDIRPNAETLRSFERFREFLHTPNSPKSNEHSLDKFVNSILKYVADLKPTTQTSEGLHSFPAINFPEIDNQGINPEACYKSLTSFPIQHQKMMISRYQKRHTPQYELSTSSNPERRGDNLLRRGSHNCRKLMEFLLVKLEAAAYPKTS
jgi:hypothetical protein